jgi:hypothetical protein
MSMNVTPAITATPDELPPFYVAPCINDISAYSSIPLKGHDFGTHRETRADEWFACVCEELINSGHVTCDTRCNSAGRAPWRYPLHEIPEHAAKYQRNKLFMTYGVFKFKSECTGDGMDHEDIAFDPIRVIDIDGKATIEQLAIIAEKLFNVGLIKSTGIQCFMRSSEDWPTEARMCFAIGCYLETLVHPLYFDRGCHLNKDGSVGNHRNHAFRLPWGSCKPGGVEKVRSWLPHDKKLATVREVFTMLELEMPPLVIRENITSLAINRVIEPTHRNNSKKYSESEKHEEYDRIRQELTDLVVSGTARLDAEKEVAAMKWKYHRPSYLGRTLEKAALKVSDGKRMPDVVWKGILEDMKELTYQLGPYSNKRRNFQKTMALFGARAWSFEFLYYQEGITLPEAIEAFFYRPCFKKVRDMSIKAIGEAAVREDLARLWNKYYHPDLINNPYHGLDDVSKSTLNLVLRHAKQLGTFKIGNICELVNLSKTQTRAALVTLCDEGKLTFIGKNRGRIYRVAKNAIAPEEACDDYRVPAITGIKTIDNRNSTMSIRNSSESMPVLHDFTNQYRIPDKPKRNPEPQPHLKI